MDDLTQTPSTIGELALWFLATVFMVAMAVLAAGTVGFLLGWGNPKWLLVAAAAGVLSVTWGSWASLLWTYNRVLKLVMVAVVTIPGVVMAVAAGWVLLNMPDNPVFSKMGPAIVAIHGLGAIGFGLLVCTRGLVGDGFGIEQRNRRLAMGWTLFPILVVAGTIALILGGATLLPQLLVEGSGTFESVARWTIGSMALMLMTTGLPAGSAHLCHRLTSR